MDSKEEYENDEGQEEDQNGEDANEVIDSDIAADDNEEVVDKNVLKEGDKFDSFEKLEKKVKNFEKKEYALFYHRDAMTIQRCRTRGMKRHIEESLKYYSIQYSCIHGGKNYKSTSKGARKAFTFQKNCPAIFNVGVDDTGHYLVIKSINKNHNHDRSENLFRHYPRSRKLTTEQKDKIAELLDLEANRLKVKNLMESQSNKIILLKDLDNCKVKKNKQYLLIPTLKKLENKFKAQWFLYEKENTFAGLFFVTESMKSVIDSYPEFLGIDATFKLLDIRAPVYLMIVENSNGCSEVAGVCILVSEDRESINWMMNSFKTAHPKWDQIKCVMTDKDINERDAIREALPSANLIICAFHTLRIFNREITTDKRNIKRDQRDAAKSILQKMVYSETEEEYDLLYEELKEMPQSVVNYFNEHWHSIRNEWSLNNTFMHGNFLNSTNNRLESLNSKIKQACNCYNTLEDFVEKLITFFCCLNSERDHKAAYAYQKNELITFEENSPLKQYHDFLTSYAFKFVLEEYDFMKFVNVDIDMPESQELIISYDGLSRIETSVDSCDCTRFRSMTLPCSFAAVYNVPFTWVTTAEPHGQVLALIDEFPNMAYNGYYIDSLPPFSLGDRVSEVWQTLKNTAIKETVIRVMQYWQYTKLIAPHIESRGRVAPSFEELKYNASLILGNSHVSMGQATRLPQAYKPIGGYHILEKLDPLPEDLTNIMESSKHGVVYFSMGSNLKSKDLPADLKKDILKVFGSLKQTVFWKFEEVLPDIPKNVHILKWAPQQSILAHPNCVLFITHGGLLSTTETIHAGVPIIGIPVFADQFNNVNRAVNKGYAKKVTLSYTMASELKATIEDVLNDPKYAQKVKELSLIYHDRPVKPGAELVHWVEHVIKTKGAPHLRSPALMTPWYQKMYLDLALVLAALIYVMRKVVKLVLPIVFPKRYGVKQKKN